MGSCTLRIALALEHTACLSFLVTHGFGTLLGAVALFGFWLRVGLHALPALISDFFGRAHAGSIVGALFAIAGSTGGIGLRLAGALNDATGGYNTTWALCATLNAGLPW